MTIVKISDDYDLGDGDDDGDDDLFVKRTLKISNKTQSKYRAKVKLNKIVAWPVEKGQSIVK